MKDFCFDFKEAAAASTMYIFCVLIPQEVNTEIIKQEMFKKHITEEEALKILGTRHAEK